MNKLLLILILIIISFGCEKHKTKPNNLDVETGNPCGFGMHRINDTCYVMTRGIEYRNRLTGKIWIKPISDTIIGEITNPMLCNPDMYKCLNDEAKEEANEQFSKIKIIDGD